MSIKVALVHDQLTQYGGAERVLDALHGIYPDAPIFTTVYRPEKFPTFYKKYDIRTTWLNRIPLLKTVPKLRKVMTVLFPFAIQSLNLKDYDLIISDTLGIAKGVKVRKNQKHLSYIHTPPWAVWDLKGEKGRLLTKYFGQKWDYKTAQRPGILVCNSESTLNRIRTFYQRDAQIIYPPVDINLLQKLTERINEKEDYIVFVGRLEGYKGELLLAQACTNLKQKLIIIGKGKNADAIRYFSKYVELKENVEDIEKASILARAKASFNGSIEDFGINMAESIAVGTPVIALNKGGATEIIEDRINGIFIPDIKVETIEKAIKEVKGMKFDKTVMQKSVEKYDKSIFVNQIQEAISKLLG